MFAGTVPTACIQQLFRIIDFETWPDLYVCCSGTFKVDRALRGKCPDARIHSNDVSLYSSAIGALLTGAEIDIRFVDRLAFVEPHLEGKPFAAHVAAVVICLEVGRFKAKNEYARRHFAYFEQHFATLLEAATAKLTKVAEDCRLDSYFCDDWRAHVDQAIEAGGAIVAFPPFFRGDYEAQFKFLETNTEWDAPAYDLYDPGELHDILTRIDDAGINYCVLSDQVFDDFAPVLEYAAGRKKPHYAYARTNDSSLRRLYNPAKPIRYKPFDPLGAKPDAEVTVAPIDSGIARYIKDVYLSKNIIHTDTAFNFAVLIDGCLAGCLCYAISKYQVVEGVKSLYLMSDVTVSRHAKLSKLVAKLATAKEVVGVIERRLVSRFQHVVTTARTSRPVSMKYRGIYDKLSMHPSDDPDEPGINIIQYGSMTRDESVQDIYQWWVDKYAPKAAAESGNPGK